MIANVFLSLGLNRDHAAFVWGKILSIALLINSGVFDLSAQAAYLGIHLSPTGAHWIQALAVIALYISGQYSTSSLPGKKIGVWLLVAGLAAGAVLLPACTSGRALQTATIAETAAVQAVHATIQTEAAAYAGGAYDRATHEKYLRALQQTVQGERALNDSLLAWAHTQNQPMPYAVVQAVRSVAGILNDLQPLIPKSTAAATLAAALSRTISLLTGATTS
jgi:hypothetical protein